MIPMSPFARRYRARGDAEVHAPGWRGGRAQNKDSYRRDEASPTSHFAGEPV